jgi:hypothetical protein
MPSPVGTQLAYVYILNSLLADEDPAVGASRSIAVICQSASACSSILLCRHAGRTPSVLRVIGQAGSLATTRSTSRRRARLPRSRWILEERDRGAVLIVDQQTQWSATVRMLAVRESAFSEVSRTGIEVVHRQCESGVPSTPGVVHDIHGRGWRQPPYSLTIVREHVGSSAEEAHIPLVGRREIRDRDSFEGVRDLHSSIRPASGCPGWCAAGARLALIHEWTGRLDRSVGRCGARCRCRTFVPRAVRAAARRVGLGTSAGRRRTRRDG